MELKAVQGKELVLELQSDVGVLSRIARLMADKGINIRAVTAEALNGGAIVRLVSDDNLRAGDALREHGYDVRDENVLLLSLHSKPGMLHRIAEALAKDAIDIRHIYASGAEYGDACLVVLKTANDDHALVELNEERSK